MSALPSRCISGSESVFALVVMAQIKAKRVKDGASRKDARVALIRLLYERGYRRKQIIQLFNIIDWMLQLPKGLEREFAQAVYAIQEEKHMPYINTAECLGLEQGRQEGLEKGLEQGRLETKRATARNLINLGVLNDEQIAEATDMSVAEVTALRREPKH